jgi:hypothetical protein
MSEALKRQREEITGAIPPGDLEKEAEIQTNRGLQLFWIFYAFVESKAKKKKRGNTLT